MDPVERRKQQNRAAQRKYRKCHILKTSWQIFLTVHLGKKMAQQMKQTEHFVQQAHSVLAELTQSRLMSSSCVHCSHCQSLNLSTTNAQTARSPFPSVSPLPRTAGWEDDIGAIATPLLDKPISDQGPSFVPRQDYFGADQQWDLMSTNVDNVAFTTPGMDDNTLDPFESMFTHTAISSKYAVTPDIVEDPIHCFDTEPARKYPTPETSELSDSGSLVCKKRNIHHTTVALQLAAREGNSAIISVVLRAGAEIDAIDTKGCTALYHAAENGHAEAIKTLLAAGADAAVADLEGTSVIIAAIRSGSERAVELILEALQHL